MPKKSLIIPIVLTLTVSACTLNQATSVTSHLNQQKCAFNKKNSQGFVESICISNTFNINTQLETKEVVFNGYNIDYPQLDGYDIQQVDPQGNVLATIKPSIPQYQYNQTFKEEYKNLNTFLNEFIKPTMTASDLDELHLKTFDANNIANLYNQAQLASTKPGKYTNPKLKPADIVIKYLDDFSCLQIGYRLDNQNIHDLNLKLDIKTDKATQTKINENLDAIENQIQTTNKLKINAKQLPHQDVNKLMHVDQIQDQLNDLFKSK